MISIINQFERELIFVTTTKLQDKNLKTIPCVLKATVCLLILRSVF